MKRRKLAPGEPVTFKIPMTATPEEIKKITQWRDRRILSKKIMEKVREDMQTEHKLSLPINRPLTNEEIKRLDNPEIQKMLGNICLALLSHQIPQLPPLGSPSQNHQDDNGQETTKTEQEWEVPDEVDDLIDDLFDDEL